MSSKDYHSVRYNRSPTINFLLFFYLSYQQAIGQDSAFPQYYDRDPTFRHVEAPRRGIGGQAHVSSTYYYTSGNRGPTETRNPRVPYVASYYASGDRPSRLSSSEARESRGSTSLPRAQDGHTGSRNQSPTRAYRGQVPKAEVPAPPVEAMPKLPF